MSEPSGPSWEPIRRVLDSSPLLPTPAEFVAVHRAIQGAGKEHR
ncbi:hypothetical protein [Streptomyces sp. NBC_00572]|nr:hypothetical protein [Streptomyces sp. NBC_00572]MCX4985895.1 hypothetical protein [Streptomyces sp. NBC_00572]